jgi:hypothetical protein
VDAEAWRAPVRLGDSGVAITETPCQMVADGRPGVGVYELVLRPSAGVLGG